MADVADLRAALDEAILAGARFNRAYGFVAGFMRHNGGDEWDEDERAEENYTQAFLLFDDFSRGMSRVVLRVGLDDVLMTQALGPYYNVCRQALDGIYESKESSDFSGLNDRTQEVHEAYRRLVSMAANRVGAKDIALGTLYAGR